MDSQSEPLYKMNSSESECGSDKISYLKMTIENEEEHELKIVSVGQVVQCIIQLENCYKYNNDNDLIYDSDITFDEVQTKLASLDINNRYKYNYIPDESILIKNPLDPNSFLNANHIYNQFTICQYNDTSKSKIVTL